eukprot:846405_1
MFAGIWSRSDPNFVDVFRGKLYTVYKAISVPRSGITLCESNGRGHDAVQVYSRTHVACVFHPFNFQTNPDRIAIVCLITGPGVSKQARPVQCSAVVYIDKVTQLRRSSPELKT